MWKHFCVQSHFCRGNVTFGHGWSRITPDVPASNRIRSPTAWSGSSWQQNLSLWSSRSLTAWSGNTLPDSQICPSVKVKSTKQGFFGVFPWFRAKFWPNSGKFWQEVVMFVTLTLKIAEITQNLALLWVKKGSNSDLKMVQLKVLARGCLLSPKNFTKTLTNEWNI